MNDPYFAHADKIISLTEVWYHFSFRRFSKAHSTTSRRCTRRNVSS